MFARGLGRKKETKRGKEPMWVSREFDRLFPAAIPHHGKTSPSAPKTACWINSKRTCGSGNKGSMKKNARNTMMMSRTPKERTMGPAEYLKRPYQRCVVPDSDGSFRGEIVEFPGCIATGETGADGLTNLEEVAVSWLETAIAKGLRIPEPMEEGGFSGKLMLRLPKACIEGCTRSRARWGEPKSVHCDECSGTGRKHVGARRRNGSIRGSVRDVLSDEQLSDCPAYRANPSALSPRMMMIPGGNTVVALPTASATKEQRHARG